MKNVTERRLMQTQTKKTERNCGFKQESKTPKTFL